MDFHNSRPSRPSKLLVEMPSNKILNGRLNSSSFTVPYEFGDQQLGWLQKLRRRRNWYHEKQKINIFINAALFQKHKKPLATSNF